MAQLEQNLKTEKDRADRVQDEYERDKEKWSKQKEGTMNMVMQKSDTIPTSSSMQKQQRKSLYEHVGRQLTGDHNEDNENFEETKKQNKKKSRFWQLSGKQKRAKLLMSMYQLHFTDNMKLLTSILHMQLKQNIKTHRASNESSVNA